ncbi:CopG family transcriptional regulator [Chloroflexota bacterium]
MSGDQAVKTVAIPAELYEKIEERVRATGFSSIEEYVTFVLEEILKDDDEEDGAAFSKEEEEEVKKRLRALGYLD